MLLNFFADLAVSSAVVENVKIEKIMKWIMKIKKMKKYQQCVKQVAKWYFIGYIFVLAIQKWNFCHTSLFTWKQTFSFFRISKFWLQILNEPGRYSRGRNCQKSLNSNWGLGRVASPPGLWLPKLASCSTSITTICPHYISLSFTRELSTYLVKHENPLEKTKFPPNRPKSQKTRKSSKWRQIHKLYYVKNQLFKNMNFWFLRQLREILVVHRSKTNNGQKSAMNFRNL